MDEHPTPPIPHQETFPANLTEIQRTPRIESKFTT